ncbi:unnamed protein product, partial [Sphacelaria rigidula]
MEVGGGDGEYVSLDVEAWEDFLESRFKRLSVTIDPETLAADPKAPPRAAGKADNGIAGKTQAETTEPEVSEMKSDVSALAVTGNSKVNSDTSLLPEESVVANPAQSFPEDGEKSMPEGVGDGSTPDDNTRDGAVAGAATEAGLSEPANAAQTEEKKQAGPSVQDVAVSGANEATGCKNEDVACNGGVRFASGSGGDDSDVAGEQHDVGSDVAEVSSVDGDIDGDVGTNSLGGDVTALGAGDDQARPGDTGPATSGASEEADKAIATGRSETATAAIPEDDTESIASKMEVLKGRLTRIASTSGG